MSGTHPSGGQTVPARPYCQDCGAPCPRCATERRQREDAARLAKLPETDLDRLRRAKKTADESYRMRRIGAALASDADERVLGAHGPALQDRPCEASGRLLGATRIPPAAELAHAWLRDVPERPEE